VAGELVLWALLQRRYDLLAAAQRLTVPDPDTIRSEELGQAGVVAMIQMMSKGMAQAGAFPLSQHSINFFH
jgi:aminoglycoside phosphotransferase (APT) family kinase protein